MIPSEHRIVFVVSSMGGGGAERVAALLSSFWASQSHHVMLLATYSGRGDCVYPLHDEVELVYLADHVSLPGRSIISQYRRLRALRGLIRNYRPTAVYSFLPHVNIATILATSGLDVPVVVSERAYPPAEKVGPGVSMARRALYPRAKRVVMQTEDGKRWLESACPRAKGTIIPNPLMDNLPITEPVILPHLLIRKGRRVLLAVGRLNEQKQYPILLEAFRSVAHVCPDWDLVILGEGPQQKMLETLIRSLQLSDRVQLVGRVGNPGEWYERASAYVSASLYEGFPNALMEALGYGLPSVSFDCLTGPRELIDQGVTGLLVDPSSGCLGLAEALRRVTTEEWVTPPAAVENLRRRLAVGRIAQLWIQAAL